MAKRARTMTLVVGDLRPIVTQYVEEEDTGEIAVLTGADSVKFWMYPLEEDGSLGTVKINGSAGAIADAAAGKLTYTWSGTDTDTAALYLAYFRVYWTAGPGTPMTVSALTVNIVPPEKRMT